MSEEEVSKGLTVDQLELVLMVLQAVQKVNKKTKKNYQVFVPGDK